MTLVLTRKGDGIKIAVETKDVKLWEPDQVSGTHVVFGADLVRVVSETFDQIMNAIGARNL